MTSLSLPQSLPQRDLTPRLDNLVHRKVLAQDDAIFVAPTDQASLSSTSVKSEPGPPTESTPWNFPPSVKNGNSQAENKFTDEGKIVVRNDSAPSILDITSQESFSRTWGPSHGDSLHTSSSTGQQPDVLTILEPPDDLSAPGVDILSTKPGGEYRNIVGTMMSLGGNRYRYTDDASLPPSERAKRVIANAKEQKTTVEEAATFRHTFANPDGSAIPDREAFEQETRAAITEQAKAEGIPVAWEAFDKIDKELMRKSQLLLGGFIFAGGPLLTAVPKERQEKFDEDVEAWVQEWNTLNAAIKGGKQEVR